MLVFLGIYFSVRNPYYSFGCVLCLLLIQSVNSYERLQKKHISLLKSNNELLEDNKTIYKQNCELELKNKTLIDQYIKMAELHTKETENIESFDEPTV